MFRGGDTPEGVQSTAKLDGAGIDYLGMKFFSDVFLGLYYDAHGNEVTTQEVSSIRAWFCSCCQAPWWRVVLRVLRLLLLLVLLGYGHPKYPLVPSM